jgi:hypothetical protein
MLTIRTRPVSETMRVADPDRMRGERLIGPVTWYNTLRMRS